jgi:hypothetical protein
MHLIMEHVKIVRDICPKQKKFHGSHYNLAIQKDVLHARYNLGQQGMLK